MDHNEKNSIVPGLTPMEIEKIYRMQYKIHWGEDFVDRCNDRRMEGQCRYDLPDILAEDKDLLNTAYELYCRSKDSNIAYDLTLDAVIDGIEKWIANDMSDVLEQVERYFAENLPKYKVLEIRRQSYHPEDDYLYMVSAKKDDGTYAVWTCWNQSIKSLNCGHYDLSSEEDCEKVMDGSYFSGDPE